MGFVGPGVQQGGIDSTTWTDHTNVCPTILSLAGLKDDYQHDGLVLIEALETKATPPTLIAHPETVRRLGDVYEQLNAPFGEFSESVLKASTKAVAGGTPGDDSHYAAVETSLADLTSQRNSLASKIKAALDAAAFDKATLNKQQANGWIDQAESLIDQAESLAASS